MRPSLAAFAAVGTTVAGAVNVTLPNGWFIIPPATDISPGDFHGQPRYLTWMADSQIKSGIEPTHAYTVSALLSGVKLAYDRTHDPKYAAYLARHVDIQLYPGYNGDILLYNNSNSIDDIRFGHSFLDMYNLTGGENIYKTAAQTLRNQIDRTGRTPDGGFYHRYPGYIDQVRIIHPTQQAVVQQFNLKHRCGSTASTCWTSSTRAGRTSSSPATRRPGTTSRCSST